MIKYDPKLAEIMQNDKTTITNYDTEVSVKCIPDESKPGVFDPREYEMALARADAFTKMANSDTKSAAPVSPADAIPAMRDMMGFPNLNMNTVEIYTRYISINSGGNDIGIWVYYPRKPERKKGRPGFIYIHGGGWVGGTPFTVENPCRLLAERADCVVFNIDYALAPEKPFPNGFNDCYAALEYIYNNADDLGIDKNKIGMGGDSAGGNLTAAVAVRDRDSGLNMLKYQCLIYPAVAFTYDGMEGFNWTIDDYELDDSQRALIDPGISIGRPKDGQMDMSGMGSLYLQNGESPKNPYVSPVFADKKGLCKATIVGAEFDGLRPSGEYYGKQLRDAGVDTRILRYKGVGHAFLDKLGFLPQAEDLVNEMAKDIMSL